MAERVQAQVFGAVARAGALTTRRLIQEFGPKPNWQRLLDQKWLREYHTRYGTVLALGSAARSALRIKLPETALPYLAGPNAVADRAFQMDALKEVQSREYTFKRHEYKRAGAVGGAARRGEGVTSQILRTYVAAPLERRRALQAHWGPGTAYQADPWGLYPAALGHPCLYASIASGGIRRPKLEALYHRHKLDIHQWRHPLLVAVPEEGELRAFIREVEARERRTSEDLIRRGLIREQPRYPLIELIILPLPPGGR